MEKTSARFSNYKKDMGESSYTTANRGRFTPATVAKEAPRAPNPYTKPAGFKRYRCGQSGHRSNECLARTLVTFVDDREDSEEEQYVEEGAEVEELLDGAEIVEEQ
ncbi:Hypothetical predicted protein [Olea europaea subsp. europaea]|uniref:CCHC-type domain-containing protein n=1 Tax=Olea europaea subsp. europaea TaxID=158383 RepID=A0A8S0TR84_OLEEU|nr:Hypothetical predicted protein [Olea europaea subsp. europaea]